jgi:geranylgeranyl diphosphate synthase, type II
MKISDYLSEISQAMAAELDRLLPSAEGEAKILAEAMRYSVFNGGKRLRPALFCSTLQTLGVEPRPYLSFAAALEMIHCYSLIHDDLPAMDDDDLRRGKPTCHIVYGEAMAILAGDALLSRAAEILSRPLPDISPSSQLAAAGEIMADAGHMVRGQAIELAPRRGKTDKKLLEQIYEGKTAALFRAAVLGAAYLAGASEMQKQALGVYALALGLSFQITDDILDIKGEAALVGKPTDSDQKNEKLTYAAVFGCEDAAIAARDAAQKAKNALAVFGGNAEILRLYPDFFVTRNM